jgi:hypothetical protein
MYAYGIRYGKRGKWGKDKIRSTSYSSAFLRGEFEACVIVLAGVRIVLVVKSRRCVKHVFSVWDVREKG